MKTLPRTLLLAVALILLLLPRSSSAIGFPALQCFFGDWNDGTYHQPPSGNQTSSKELLRSGSQNVVIKPGRIAWAERGSGSIGCHVICKECSYRLIPSGFITPWSISDHRGEKTLRLSSSYGIYNSGRVTLSVTCE